MATKTYELGDTWCENFDYVGMLEAGTKAEVSWGIEKLEKLLNSFEDVNFHKQSAPLHRAISYLKLGAYKNAGEELEIFRKLCEEELTKMKK